VRRRAIDGPAAATEASGEAARQRRVISRTRQGPPSNQLNTGQKPASGSRAASGHLNPSLFTFKETR
jgi:hypothetical protein